MYTSTISLSPHWSYRVDMAVEAGRGVRLTVEPGSQNDLENASGTSLSIPPTLSPIYKVQLILSHTLALLPAVLVIITTIYVSFWNMGICNMQILFPEADDDICTSVLSFRIMLVFGIIGSVCWYAMYKLRPFFWEVSFVIVRVIAFVMSFFKERLDDYEVVFDTSIAFGSSVIRTVLVELLRVICQEVCVLMIIALAWWHNLSSAKALSKESHECVTGVDDPRFTLSLWLGCGWATAEILAGSYQIFKFVPLYRTLGRPELGLDEEEILTDYVQAPNGEEGGPGTSSLSSLSSSQVSNELEELSLDELILMREKTEFEQQLGDYLENVPPAIITLWRIDSLFWQLGSCLLIGNAITAAQGCSSLDEEISLYQFIPFPALSTFSVTFWSLVAVHTLGTLTWSFALPKIGLTNVTYTSMLVGALLLVAGLGTWDVLI